MPTEAWGLQCLRGTAHKPGANVPDRRRVCESECNFSRILGGREVVERIFQPIVAHASLIDDGGPGSCPAAVATGLALTGAPSQRCRSTARHLELWFENTPYGAKVCRVAAQLTLSMCSQPWE